MWQWEIPLTLGEGLIRAGSDTDEVCLHGLIGSFRWVGSMITR